MFICLIVKRCTEHPRWRSSKCDGNYVKDANGACFCAVSIKSLLNSGSSWHLTESVWSKDGVGSWRPHRNHLNVDFGRVDFFFFFFSPSLPRFNLYFFPPAAVWSEAVAARWRLERWLNYQQTTFGPRFFVFFFQWDGTPPKTFRWCKWNSIHVM